MPPKKWSQTKTNPVAAPTPESVAMESSDSEIFDVSGVNQKKRKDKRVATLSEPEEEIMLTWLKEHPEFYNRRMMEYKNIPRKEALWKEKASEMGKSVEHLKTWYRSMRTRMARLIRTKTRKANDELTDRDVWVIENLSFLRKHIEAVHRRPMKSIAQRAATTTSQGRHPVITIKTEPTSNTAETPVSTTSTSPVPKIPELKRPGVSDRSLVSTLEDLTKHVVTMQHHLVDRLQPEGDQERLAFSEWVRATLVGLEHDVWRRTQRDIADVLFRAIAENDAAQQWPSQVPNATAVWGSASQQQQQLPHANSQCSAPQSQVQVPTRPSSAPPASSTSSSPDFSQDVSGFINNLLRNFDTRYNLQDTR